MTPAHEEIGVKLSRDRPGLAGCRGQPVSYMQQLAPALWGIIQGSAI